MVEAFNRRSSKNKKKTNAKRNSYRRSSRGGGATVDCGENTVDLDMPHSSKTHLTDKSKNNDSRRVRRTASMSRLACSPLTGLWV